MPKRLAIAVLITAALLPTVGQAARRTTNPEGGEMSAGPSGQGVKRNPRWGGYRYNEFGYGQFTPGEDGGFGGYPPNSDGARELRNEQRYKCRDVDLAC